jgi:hypothetical protein
VQEEQAVSVGVPRVDSSIAGVGIRTLATWTSIHGHDSAAGSEPRRRETELRIIRVGLTVSLAALVLAACGSSAPTTSSVSVPAARTAYLAAITPTGVALSGFATMAESWNGSTTAAQASADARAAIAALQSFSTTLKSEKWPAGATADVHTLHGDVVTLTGDLQGLATLNMAKAATWFATFVRDAEAVRTAVGLVQHDLGVTANDLRLVPECQADAKTVGVGVAAYQAENPKQFAGYTSSDWKTHLLGNSSATNVGGPFLASWPTKNSAFYTITVAGPNAPKTTGDGVTPTQGDVIVTATSSGLTYDATANPVTACLHIL